ncbi:hypothetical protein ACFQT0_24910 [Hymenobacter humi]|uniref:Uncharacterized protein n=1 Tax=Hymenobacter humi TaxID=1411620 RepID=A0ABW2UA63_9BACT
MKHLYLPLLAAALVLAGCNQTAPVTSTPTAEAPATVTPADTARPDSAMAATLAPPADNAAAPAETPAAAPALKPAETLKMSFAFKPAPNPDDPAHPKTSAYLLLQGAKPMEIDLGKFAARPDVVDATKAKLAGFPKDMLLGFRSYHASSGTRLRPGRAARRWPPPAHCAAPRGGNRQRARRLRDLPRNSPASQYRSRSGTSAESGEELARYHPLAGGPAAPATVAAGASGLPEQAGATSVKPGRGGTKPHE